MLMGRCCLCSVLCNSKWFPSGHEGTAHQIDGGGILPIPLPEQYPDTATAVDFFSLRNFPTCVSADAITFGSQYPLQSGFGFGGTKHKLPATSYVGGDASTELAFSAADSYTQYDFFKPHVIQPNGVDFSPVSLPLNWDPSTTTPSCAAARDQVVTIESSTANTTPRTETTFSYTLDRVLCSKAVGATYNNYNFDTFDHTNDPGFVLISNAELDTGVNFEDLELWSEMSAIDMEAHFRDAWNYMMLGDIVGAVPDPSFPDRIFTRTTAKHEFESSFNNGTATVDYAAWQSWFALLGNKELVSVSSTVDSNTVPVPAPSLEWPIANPVVNGQQLRVSTATFNAVGGESGFTGSHATLIFPGVSLFGNTKDFVYCTATVTVAVTFAYNSSLDGVGMDDLAARSHWTRKQAGSHYRASGTVTGTSSSWRSAAHAASLPLDVAVGDITVEQGTGEAYIPGGASTVHSPPSNNVSLNRVPTP